ncbi:MAG: hypothetical protein HN725_06945 [Alphaproteobacteria bacterium]|jgi:hypothetical protein|nr:hypothetical protein [Alphaproteobacteria bacterium]MBT4084112.1 hypothetical protein [Alphaproteobacteria bacterium]MBT4544374.1 hypothetical protein [Alphaproteobacteria bacterium]MBT7745013.1 hypothetical protein [Alphaproteobacteria bacterium]
MTGNGQNDCSRFFAVAILAIVFALCTPLMISEVSANEIQSADRLYNHHQRQSLVAAKKLQELRQEYAGQLEKAPATLVVPLIDKAVSHMRWARAYAPNAESRKILEFNAKNLERLRKKIMDGQSPAPRKKGVCTGDDEWITA